MLTANALWVRTASLVVSPWATETMTMGGSSEMEVNELAVIAQGSPSAIVVTSVTPVANWPSTCL
ncbi:MAG: hypothetical protein WKH64_02735 [Chloroflexia bacterium]